MVKWKTYHLATLPSLGTALAVAVSCSAAASSSDMVLRARVVVVKSRWRRSGVNRKGMMDDRLFVDVDGMAKVELFDGDSGTGVVVICQGWMWWCGVAWLRVLGVSDSA
jgi:hypothetical protein